MPPGLKEMVDSSGRCSFGWIFFVSAGKLTAAHVASGVPMLSPVELVDGLDAMGEWVEERLRLMMWHGLVSSPMCKF